MRLPRCSILPWKAATRVLSRRNLLAFVEITDLPGKILVGLGRYSDDAGKRVRGLRVEWRRAQGAVKEKRKEMEGCIRDLPGLHRSLHREDGQWEEGKFETRAFHSAGTARHYATRHSMERYGTVWNSTVRDEKGRKGTVWDRIPSVYVRLKLV